MNNICLINISIKQKRDRLLLLENHAENCKRLSGADFSLAMDWL